jgi:hypothetical protein
MMAVQTAVELPGSLGLSIINGGRPAALIGCVPKFQQKENWVMMFQSQ